MTTPIEPSADVLNRCIRAARDGTPISNDDLKALLQPWEAGLDLNGRPGKFAVRPLRAHETFDVRTAPEQSKQALALCEGFEEHGTSISAIESILAADRATLFPLPATLHWLIGCLRQWHLADGALTMDQAMGLAAAGKGQEPDAVRNLLAKRNLHIAQDMSMLIALGFAAREAGGLISGAIERAGEFPPIAGRTVERLWPSLKDRYKGVLPMYSAHARQMSATERRKYLRQFGSPTPPVRKK